MIIRPKGSIPRRPLLPGDKSLSHRMLFMAALANGTSLISNISFSEDVQSTIYALEALGVPIHREYGNVRVTGVGFGGLREPQDIIDCGNSGTTARHLLALCAASSFSTFLTGDRSLRRRPMRRMADPLRKMGAEIELKANETLPGFVRGRQLHSVEVALPMASGQVKSALLMAAAAAGVEITLVGKLSGRDHTEKLIPFFGGKIVSSPEKVMMPRQSNWHSVNWTLPSDPSAAAFWMAAAAMLPGACVEFDSLLLNPTRLGFVEILRKMGAHVEIETRQQVPELVGRVRVEGRYLKAVEISEDEIPSMIDEVSLLALVASQAEGATIIRGASELRFKESDRIEVTAGVLKALGVDVITRPDGFVIQGKQKVRGGIIPHHGDHRLAMLGITAGFVAEDIVEVHEPSCIAVSDPVFLSNFEGGVL